MFEWLRQFSWSGSAAERVNETLVHDRTDGPPSSLTAYQPIVGEETTKKLTPLGAGLHKNEAVARDRTDGPPPSLTADQPIAREEKTKKLTPLDVGLHRNISVENALSGQFTHSVFNMNSGDVHITKIMGPQSPTTVEDCNNNKALEVLGKNLRRSLKSGALGRALDQDNLLKVLDCKITPVRLQLLDEPYPLKLPGEDRCNGREDVIKLCEIKSGNIELENIFDLAKEAVLKRAPGNLTEDEKREIFQHKGNTVVVLGNAGVGKTTFTKMFIRKVMDKQLLPDCEYIFYIPIRYIDFTCENNFLKFAIVNASGGYLPGNDEKLLSLLQNHAVLFVFDGLDEARMDCFEEKLTSVSELDSKRPDVFIKNILMGNILPNSKKLVTSRPREFYDMHHTCRPDYVVSVLGVDADSQEELRTQICGEKADEVKKHLDAHPDLSAACHIPATCIIILAILFKSITEGKRLNIRSITCIFVTALSYYVRSDILKQKASDVWKLTHLAWDGFKDRKYVFDVKDLQDAGIDLKAVDAFLATFLIGRVGCSILKRDQRSYFSHLIWQELFAAIYIKLYLPLNEFIELVANLQESHWQVVAKFLFGLSNDSVINSLQHTLDLPSDCIETWKERTERLKAFALKILSDCATFQGKSKAAEKTRVILQVCEWAHEMQDDEFTTKVANGLPDALEITGCKFLPTDAVNLIYVSQKVSAPFTIEVIQQNTFVQDALRRLLKGLSSLTLFEGISYMKLRTNGMDTADFQALADSLPMISMLDMKSTLNRNVTCDEVAILAKEISKLPYPMEKLDLSFNEIGDEGAAILFECLHKIRKLHVGYCKFTEYSIKLLADKLITLPDPMEELDITYNFIGDVGADHLLKSLHKITKLDLAYCGITDDGLKRINDKLSAIPKPKPNVEGAEWVMQWPFQ